MFTRALIDKWDPELRLRNKEQRITALQIVTLPFIILCIPVTFFLDIVTLPWQIRHIYRD